MEELVMANLARWNPFRELTRFDPFTDVEDFFKEFGMRPAWRGIEVEPQIRLDVSEDDQTYTVKAEIPGVRKEDINVSVDGNLVSLSAEVKSDKEEKQGRKVVRRERYHGSVSRSFTLAQDVDMNRAEAKYEDGVLHLTLPKKPGAAAKKLTVR
jgi:HSP20 family protein